jgi:tRNA-splicing ligase RtcB
MKIIQGKNTFIKSWCENPESEALDQARNIAMLPNVFKHVVLLPDTHKGYGMPIGGVVALKDAISPSMVGKDIGCGMCAVKTSLTDIDEETLKKIMSEIRKVIPLGFSHQKDKQDANLMPKRITNGKNLEKICDEQYESALKQIGTLGGGNHFIEIQKGDDGYIWIMIHSGSRNLGSKVADYYDKIAIELNEKYHTNIEKSWGLNFLPIDSNEGQIYLKEMQYCVDFALANRKLMMERILEIVYNSYEETYGSEIKLDEMINIAHNYAKLENHFGKNVWVHRKGATLATDKTIGIIPGSQGSSSYIVKGKGNPESFMSCSHGAGRRMSRSKAKELLDVEDEIAVLELKGIIHSIRDVNDLDEAPGAYKNIDLIMEEQEDLVEILVKLSPLAVIKG